MYSGPYIGVSRVSQAWVDDVTGTPVTFTYWDGGEGEPGSTGDCVRLDGDKWTVVDCQAQHTVLCQVDAYTVGRKTKQ